MSPVKASLLTPQTAPPARLAHIAPRSVTAENPCDNNAREASIQQSFTPYEMSLPDGRPLFRAKRTAPREGAQEDSGVPQHIGRENSRSVLLTDLQLFLA